VAATTPQCEPFEAVSAQLYHRSVLGILERLYRLWAEDGQDDELDFASKFRRLKSAHHQATQEERGLFVALQNTASQAQWNKVEDLFEEMVSNSDDIRSKGLDLAQQVWNQLEQHKFDDADALVHEHQEFVNLDHYESARYRKRVKHECQRQAALLAKRKAERAQELKRQTELKAKRQEALQKRRDEITAKLTEALRVSVHHADQVQMEIDPENLVDYSELKAAYVHQWLRERFDDPFPEAEQSSAVAEMHPSYLLRARAGSGKTSVIAAKARFLLEHESLDPDQLMILAFNTKAADEITKRISKEQGINTFDNARTFHSLAYQIVGQPKNILGNAKTGDTQEQTAFVQRLVRTVLNPLIKAQILLFFRQEIEELDEVGALLSDADYYTYRRSHVQDSLKGQPVKSVGEKWLADFLFENDIHYVYEPTYRWDTGQKGKYKPDFGIKHRGYWSVVIEHWGIDLDDRTQQVPPDWTKSWQDYRNQIDEKRDYWSRYNEMHPDKPVLLLESSEAERRKGREAFEAYLADLLTEAGIPLNPLSEAELYQRVVIDRIARFSKMCLGYIQKAKMQRLEPGEMAKKIADSQGIGLRKSSFLRVANNIYRRYEKELEKQDLTDFDGLMDAAIRKVHKYRGNCQFEIDKGRYVKLNELRWIMIDEYQDFSRLFFDLIDAIRTYNPSVRLFCVGDNWQAINGFAGSDLRYFNRFEEYIPNARIGLLRNNYRSAPEIVDNGNRFMQSKGDGSVAINRKVRGEIRVVPVDKEWIELRSSDQYADKRENDEIIEGLQPDSL
jgi:DNA helicase-4